MRLAEQAELTLRRRRTYSGCPEFYLFFTLKFGEENGLNGAKVLHTDVTRAECNDLLTHRF